MFFKTLDEMKKNCPQNNTNKNKLKWYIIFAQDVYCSELSPQKTTLEPF